MGIIYLVPIPTTHWCNQPSNPEKLYGVGTIWECEGCNKLYKLSVVQDPRERLPEYYWKEMCRD